MSFPVLKSNDGTPVVVYSTDAGGLYPIHGAYQGEPGVWYPTVWDALGYHIRVSCPTHLDITMEIHKVNNGNQEKNQSQTEV